MPYETSYDSGLSPFNHDKTRAKWPRPTDFVFACIGHAFKVDTIFIVTSYFLLGTGIFGVIVYLLVTATCTVPIVFMQSFLGQFSGTGFISVFRIAPLLKGIGLVSLVLNVATLTYYSIFAAIPMFFLLNTLRPTIPWSCEGMKSWMTVVPNNTTPCEKHSNLTEFVIMQVPSIEFFKDHVNASDFLFEAPINGHFSWPLMMCTSIVWILVGFVMTRNFEMISKFLRYSCIVVCSIIGLFLVRFAFLPGAFGDLAELMEPNLFQFAHTFYTIPVVALSCLGPGWGSVLTMASFNKFKANIFDFSWIICLAHFGVVVGLVFIAIFTSSFLRRDDTNFLHFDDAGSLWIELLMIPSALTFIGMTRILTLIFLSMVILGSMNLMVVQLVSVLTSLFDEYPFLRSLKMEVTLGLIGALGLISLYSCHNHGIHFFTLLSQFSILTQVILNLLLLLVVLWIYGREKFQRDLKFMTDRTYPTWMVNVVRFVAPISLCFLLLVEFLLAIYTGLGDEGRSTLAVVALMLITLGPWLLVPGYCAYKLSQSHGPMRIRRGLRPTDWYPVDPEDRQNYEQMFSNVETGQQLTSNME